MQRAVRQTAGRLAIAVVVLTIIATSGCLAHRSGTSSMELIPAEPLGTPPAPNPRAEPSPLRIDYIESYPRKPFTMPPYPASALAARAGRYVAYVTFTVDETGRATDIRRSRRHPEIPNRFSDQFFQAVRDTVARWDFEPAHQVYWQKVAGKDDRFLRQETVSETVEMKFTFESSGTVR